MPTGADLRGETAYLAESHPKGCGSSRFPRRNWARCPAREVHLNLPLERIVLRYQPSDSL